jgi:microcystin-dependent protein
MPDLPITFTVGALPLDQSYTPQGFADAIAQRLSASTGQSYSLFTSGAVLPSSDTGPHFLTTESTWYYFDYNTGNYQPQKLAQKSLRYIVTDVTPSSSDYDIWYRIAADGTPLDVRKWQASQWVAFPTDYANISNKPNLAPVGVMHDWPTNTAPQDFLICNGAAVLRGQYAALFAVIGTTYGVGDGSTTFNLPDFRGRVAVGSGTGDASDATAWSLGAKRGTEGVSLTATQNAEHQHLMLFGETRGAGAPQPSTTSSVASGYFVSGEDRSYTLREGTGDADIGLTGESGTGAAHANIQPSLTVNKIIRYQ